MSQGSAERHGRTEHGGEIVETVYLPSGTVVKYRLVVSGDRGSTGPGGEKLARLSPPKQRYRTDADQPDRYLEYAQRDHCMESQALREVCNQGGRTDAEKHGREDACPSPAQVVFAGHPQPHANANRGVDDDRAQYRSLGHVHCGEYWAYLGKRSEDALVLAEEAPE